MDDSLFSPRDVARVFGIPESRLLYWVRTGVVGPSVRRAGRALFTFQDLISVKAAKELIDRGATLQAVRRNLMALRQQLPQMERALQRLRVISDGEELAVVADDVAFEPLSGQVLMDFVVGALSTHVAEVMQLPSREESGAHRTPDAAPPRTAYGWFLQGCALETEPDGEAGANDAYRRALALDPSLSAAHTNLGNLAYRGGRRGESREHYERALALDPEQPEARYNLANLLDELGDTALAITEWTRVVALTPDFADAHFNLGAAHARTGTTSAACAHLERYLALDVAGDWATSARELLTQLRTAPPTATAR